MENIERPDRERFREIVESGLLGLHEGNFARYRIRPSEFAAWCPGAALAFAAARFFDPPSSSS